MFRTKSSGRLGILFFFVLLTACAKTSSPTPDFVEVTSTIYKDFPSTNSLPGCQSISQVPTSGPEEKSIFPAVNGDDHVKGALNADVTIIEYGDFQCPGCAALAQELRKLDVIFPTELRIVFRQLPLYDIHDKALLAAQAAEAASIEGKFWELHDLLFENFVSWVSLSPESFSNWMVDQVASIGLDPYSFQNNLMSPEIINKVNIDLEKALKIGLRSTPFLLINGQIYNGPTDYKSLAQIIGLIELGKRQFTSCPEMDIDPYKQYLATLQTEKGDIVFQLFADKAPFAVNAFIFLVKNGWYDNITFFKAFQGIVYTGDPSGTGLGNPGFIYDIELDETLSFDQPGMVAMLNSGLGTNGSQFFITTRPQKKLNGRFTIIGQVISGFDVLEKLTSRIPEEDTDIGSGDLLIKVTVVEN